MDLQRTNWAGNVTFAAGHIHRPTTLAGLRRLVARSERIRALGTGHSFSRIADSPGDLVSVAGLPAEIDIDPDRGSVTVSGGLRYGEVAGHLHHNGLALRNLGSLPHISIAGACATGTHGSGDGNGSLATAVLGLELVTANGDVVALSRGEDSEDATDFAGAVVALGCLGIVTRLTLEVAPTYTVRQCVYEELPREQLDQHFAEIFGSAYSVSLFTDWTGARIKQAWLKQVVDSDDAGPPAPQWFGARLADGPRHPADAPAARCTEQLGRPGPWHERLPHFRLEYTPSVGEELQSEYLLPRAHAIEAVAALDRVADRIAPVLQVSEIRTVAADDMWLSPSYGRDSVAMHFTWIRDVSAVAPVVRAVEEALAPFAARPHWGKIFALEPYPLAKLYERLPDFRRLARRFDPTGKFSNELTERYLSA